MEFKVAGVSEDVYFIYLKKHLLTRVAATGLPAGVPIILSHTHVQKLFKFPQMTGWDFPQLYFSLKKE